jgi:hypothetical protein
MVDQQPISLWPQQIPNGNRNAVSKNTEFINENLMGMPALGEDGHPNNETKRRDYVYLQSEVKDGRAPRAYHVNGLQQVYMTDRKHPWTRENLVPNNLRRIVT